MDKLHFDKMEVNTDLAKEYFKKNNHQFPSDPVNGLESEKDGGNNTIFYTNSSTTHINFGESRLLTHDLTIELDQKFRRLAEEVEKNAETFCQIEFMIRKIPVNEVREYDIKLIVQNLLLGFRASSTPGAGNILMGENTPLFNLGFVVQWLKEYDEVYIISNTNTAAVCHFFVELCHKVGLDSVKTTCVKMIPPNSYQVSFTGCIGVIMERSDVDSAVDTFVRTTTRYPWRLSLVLVAESALGAFEAARARAGGAGGAGDGLALPLAAPGAAPVPADTFRTSRELLARLREHGQTCLSLWASDVAAAHEIAYGAPAALVWVNGYGAFDGPPQASQAIYTQIPLDVLLRPIMCTPGLLKKQEAWANMTFEERRGIVLDVTNEFSADELNNEQEKKFFESLNRALRNVRSENFVDVASDRICVGLSVPRKVIIIDNANDYFSTEEKTENLAKLLTVGSAVIYHNGWLVKYFDRLASRIPITMNNNGNEAVDALVLNLGHNGAQTKVVWTSFGTIFAN